MLTQPVTRNTWMYFVGMRKRMSADKNYNRILINLNVDFLEEQNCIKKCCEGRSPLLDNSNTTYPKK